jgi:hypothetical protein
MKIKYSIEDMKKLAENKGGKCLSEEYVKNHVKLTWQCSEGHIWEASPNTILSNHWCRKCAYNRFKTIEYMQKIAEDRAGKCLSTKFSKIYLTWQCSEGHIWEAAPRSIKEGKWCKECSSLIYKTNMLKKMQELAKNRGGKCLSTEYLAAKKKLIWQCNAGHIWKAAMSGHIINGGWCPKCSFESKKDTIENMQKIAKDRAGKCLSTEYLKSNKKLTWQCHFNHIWDATPNAIKIGQWCPYCCEGVGERVCRLIFETVFSEKFIKIRPDWLRSPTNNRKLELDGYCDKLNIAFEYNGFQHYENNALYPRSKYDDVKIQKCKENGVNLFIIKEVKNTLEYKNILSQIEDQLNSFGIVVDTKIDIQINDVYKTNHSELYLSKIQKISEEHDGKCLSDNYIDSVYKLKFKCKYGHIWNTSPANIISGYWCPECGVINKTGKNNSRSYTINKMIEIADNKNGKCLSAEYLGSNEKLMWQCKLGHVWKATPGHIMHGSWCPKCYFESKKKNK